MSDRPVRDVEITPQMIEAGVSALLKWLPDAEYVSDREAVREIFLAMLDQDIHRRTLLAQGTDQTVHTLSP